VSSVLPRGALRQFTLGTLRGAPSFDAMRAGWRYWHVERQRTLAGIDALVRACAAQRAPIVLLSEPQEELTL
jgi:hypothetical protein